MADSKVVRLRGDALEILSYYPGSDENSKILHMHGMIAAFSLMVQKPPS